MGMLVLVVVDKRCSVDWQQPEGAIRAVRISLTPIIASVTVMTDDGQATTQTAPLVDLQLKAAGAAVLVLRGDESVVAMARALRKWRFEPAAASLAQASNTQMSYYTHYFPKAKQPKTSMLIALNTLDSWEGALDDNAAAQLQDLHFTAAIVATDDENDDDTTAAVALSALMRRGLYGILASSQPLADLGKFGCSPSLAGLLLADGLPVNANDTAALQKLGASCADMRWKAGHMLPLVIAGTGTVANLTASEAIGQAGCPTSPFRFRKPDDPDGIDSSVPRTKLEAETLQDEIAKIAVGSTNKNGSNEYTMMIEVHGPAAMSGPYALRAAGVRFSVWVGLMWGARGFLFSNLPHELCDILRCTLPAIGELNRRVTAVAGRLEKAVRPSRAFTAVGGVDVCPRSHCAASQRPGENAQGAPDASVLVQSMDAHLIVYVVQSCNSSFALLGCPTPPMLLVLDTRVDARHDTSAAATVTLLDRVWGWMPIEGDCAAGFVTCAKMVVGNELSLQLRPGDAQLVALTVAR